MLRKYWNELKPILQTELNVKDVILYEDQNEFWKDIPHTTEIFPNYKNLAKTFGKDTHEIANYIKSLNNYRDVV